MNQTQIIRIIKAHTSELYVLIKILCEKNCYYKIYTKELVK